MKGKRGSHFPALKRLPAKGSELFFPLLDSDVFEVIGTKLLTRFQWRAPPSSSRSALIHTQLCQGSVLFFIIFKGRVGQRLCLSILEWSFNCLPVTDGFSAISSGI